MPTTILDSESYTEALQHRCKEETKTEERINIIELAKKAGYDEQSETIPSFQNFIERFATIVRAEALEKAIEVCRQIGGKFYMAGDDLEGFGADECVEAIKGLK